MGQADEQWVLDGAVLAGYYNSPEPSGVTLRVLDEDSEPMHTEPLGPFDEDEAEPNTGACAVGSTQTLPLRVSVPRFPYRFDITAAEYGPCDDEVVTVDHVFDEEYDTGHTGRLEDYWRSMEGACEAPTDTGTEG